MASATWAAVTPKTSSPRLPTGAKSPYIGES